MEVSNKEELIIHIERQLKAEKNYSIYPDTNNDGRRLETYDQFAKEFARCRDPKKGRKISASFRLFKTVQQGVTCYDVHVEGYGSTALMRITPDNIVEFVAPPSVVWQHSQSIVSSSFVGYHSCSNDTRKVCIEYNIQVVM